MSGLSSTISPDSPTFYYDLLNQNLTIITINGPSEVPFSAIDAYYKYKILLATFFGIRVSSCAVIAVMLLLIIKERTRPIYICNLVSLFLLFMQSALYLQYLSTSYSQISTNFTGSFASVSQNDINISVVDSVCQFMLVTSIQFSLFFQVRTVFPERTVYRKIAAGVTGAVAIICIVFNFLFIITRCASAVNPNKTIFNSNSRFSLVLPSISQYTLLASIVIACMVLVGKLLFAIRVRKILGCRQFGPLEIITIMSTQSMIIPVILYVLNNTTSAGTSTAHQSYVSGIAAIAPLAVVISLPMSAMWAASANTSPYSNRELKFSNYRASDICICGRPKGFDGDFDARSYSNSIFNKYGNQQLIPADTFGQKVKKLLIRIDYLIFHGAVYSAKESQIQRSQARNYQHDPRHSRDIESLAEEKLDATTQLSISNIGTPRSKALPGNLVIGGVSPSVANFTFTAQGVAQTPTTPYSKYSFEKGVIPLSSKDATSISVHRTFTGSDINDAEYANGLYQTSGGVIIHRNDNPQSPTDTIVTQTQLFKEIGTAQTSLEVISPTTLHNQGVQEEESDSASQTASNYRQELGRNTVVSFINPDLLSINDSEESEEEYYNRMKYNYGRK